MNSAESYLARESPDLVLPVTLFSRYLQFLARRPISESNLHYRATRVAGLRSLIPALAAAPQPELKRVAEQLRTLTPANLVRLAPEMHRTLRVFREPLLPRRYLPLNESPDTEFFAGVHRVLILIGPAIGIGDEIITFPLPRALHRIMPGASISVASAYPKVWDRVDRVDRVEHYVDLASMVNTIRSGEFDLLLLVDFENPALVNAICHERSVSRYIELALGPRQLLALDNRRHRQWRMPVAEPNLQNYYDCVEGMCQWLGASGELDTTLLMPVTNRPAPEQAEELVIFVNPFTSKEDPSERYWAELLCSVLPEHLPRPAHMLLNTGPSLATRSLAFGLARTVEAHYASRDARGQLRVEVRTDVRVEVPSQPGKPGTILGIGDIFTFSDRADLIITADSFPAHAAQIFRRLTVVLGKPRTEPWRSPSENSFYFSSVDSLRSIAAAIQKLLTDLLTPPAQSARHLASAATLYETVESLEELLATPILDKAHAARLLECWAFLRDAQSEFLEQAHKTSPEYAVLFDDNAYPDLLPALSSLQAVHLTHTPELRLHLERRFREWKNSNLAKYVRHRVQPSEPHATDRVLP